MHVHMHVCMCVLVLPGKRDFFFQGLSQDSVESKMNLIVFPPFFKLFAVPMIWLCHRPSETVLLGSFVGLLSHTGHI